MKSCLTKFGIGLIAFVGLMVWSIIGGESLKPSPKPPEEASDVHFYKRSGWQSLSYQYRFDAPEQVCKEFAIELMKKQSINDQNAVIKMTEFESFPVNANFQSWFDVQNIRNGTLITADDWIYAVIDHDRKRLYYYNSH
jgi:hypothetical protein